MPKRVYSHAYASIRFMGPTLDPLAVTKILRLPPDNQHRNGEPRLTRSRNGDVKEGEEHLAGLWAMSSKEWVQSPVLETHVDWLLCQIEPLADAVHRLIAEGVDVDVFCYSLGRSKELPSLSRATRERAESLGIRIDIDHYVE